MRFRDRSDAGRRLAVLLSERGLDHPLVLAVPRGGVAVAAPIAERLAGELDVALVKKLRHPDQPELAIGAVGEDGDVVLNRSAAEEVGAEYLEREREERLRELREQSRAIRDVRPAADIAGRDVILVDDGAATGSSIMAAAEVVQRRGPRRLLIALPVAPPSVVRRLAAVADDVVCALAPPVLYAVGQFYDRFDQVEDAEVVRLLQAHAAGEARG